MNELTQLPTNLPAPIDDGACNHLLGRSLPSVSLISTQGKPVNLSEIAGRVVVYCYPMTGQPGVPLPDGWDEIPGARGCTPQSCSFRDHYQELKELGAAVYGLSIQTTEYQQEAKDRLHLPFELLSDCDLDFTMALKLPLFTVGEQRLIKRVTLIIEHGTIINVFYPIFPPDHHANEVINWLRKNTL